MIRSRRCWWSRFGCLAVLAGFSFVVSGGCSKPESKVIICSAYPADAAVRDVLAGLEQQKFVALWRFLPESFQDDVRSLVRDFSDRLDEKTWEPFVATAQKAQAVLAQLAKQSAESGNTLSEADQQLVSQLQALEKVMVILCDSELRSPATIMTLDVERFVATIGDRLLAALPAGTLDGGFAQFREVKVEQLESQGDSTLLAVQWPGQEPTQHRFVRIQDRWIPQTLAEAWPTEFPKVREKVLAWADELRMNPEPWHARLQEVDRLLDELAATNSLDEARQVGRTGLSRLATSWLGLTVPDWPKGEEIPVESSPPVKPVRVKKPDTEVLLPDEPEK